MFSSNFHQQQIEEDKKPEAISLEIAKPKLDGFSDAKRVPLTLRDFTILSQLPAYPNNHVGSYFYEEARLFHLFSVETKRHSSCMRFVVRTDTSLAFANDDDPSPTICSHAQMLGHTSTGITGGMVFENERHEICAFDHNVGSLHADFNSLQFFIIRLIEAYQKKLLALAPMIEVKPFRGNVIYVISKNKLIKLGKKLKKRNRKLLTPAKIAEHVANSHAPINYLERPYHAIPLPKAPERSNPNVRVRSSFTQSLSFTNHFNTPTKIPDFSHTSNTDSPTPSIFSYASSTESPLSTMSHFESPIKPFSLVLDMSRNIPRTPTSTNHTIPPSRPTLSSLLCDSPATTAPSHITGLPTHSASVPLMDDISSQPPSQFNLNKRKTPTGLQRGLFNNNNEPNMTTPNTALPVSQDAKKECLDTPVKKAKPFSFSAASNENKEFHSPSQTSSLRQFGSPISSPKQTTLKMPSTPLPVKYKNKF